MAELADKVEVLDDPSSQSQAVKLPEEEAWWRFSNVVGRLPSNPNSHQGRRKSADCFRPQEVNGESVLGRAHIRAHCRRERSAPSADCEGRLTLAELL